MVYHPSRTGLFDQFTKIYWYLIARAETAQINESILQYWNIETRQIDTFTLGIPRIKKGHIDKFILSKYGIQRIRNWWSSITSYHLIVLASQSSAVMMFARTPYQYEDHYFRYNIPVIKIHNVPFSYLYHVEGQFCVCAQPMLYCNVVSHWLGG